MNKQASPAKSRQPEGYSRRRFLRHLSALSAVSVVGFDPVSRNWLTTARASAASMGNLPSIEGMLIVEGPVLTDFAHDQGRHVERRPLAVLKPASVRDIQAMVEYANRHQLKIAMRGRGHSHFGQSLVEGGIVIDSTTLIQVKMAGADRVDAEPGATWGEVNETTLSAGRTPAVMPDTMETVTVGGTLNVGGLGETSHHFGAIVDNVEEVDVVTGDGRLVTCSSAHESELFEMALAGLGQCGLIVRARLKLVPAPSHVVRQELVYDNLDAFIADSSRLVLDRRFDYQRMATAPKHVAAGRFTMILSKACGAEQNVDLKALLAGLEFRSAAPPARVSYRDYLWRNGQRDRDMYLKMPDPTLRRAPTTLFVPASRVREFAAKNLPSLADSAPALSFGMWPVNVRRCTRPLLKLPREEVAFGFWIFRNATAGTPGYAELLDSNRALFEQARDCGGKSYTPYGPAKASKDWPEHYEPQTWTRLTNAKKKFDPNGVLTPGPNIFA